MPIQLTPVFDRKCGAESLRLVKNLRDSQLVGFARIGGKALLGLMILGYSTWSLAVGYAIKTREGERLGFLAASAHQSIVLSLATAQLLERIADSTTQAYFELLRQDHPTPEQQKVSFRSITLKQAVQASRGDPKYQCIASLGDLEQFSRETKQPKSLPSFLKAISAAMNWPLQTAVGMLKGPMVVNDRHSNIIPADFRFIAPDALMLAAFERKGIRIGSLGKRRLTHFPQSIIPRACFMLASLPI